MENRAFRTQRRFAHGYRTKPKAVLIDDRLPNAMQESCLLDAAGIGEHAPPRALVPGAWADAFPHDVDFIVLHPGAIDHLGFSQKRGSLSTSHGSRGVS